MKKLLKRIGIAFGALLLLALVVFGVLVAINAGDEELSPEAKRFIAVPVQAAPEEKNGYVHFLGHRAPEGTTHYAHGTKVLEVLRASDKPGFVKTAEWNELVKSPPFEKDARPCLPESAPCIGAEAQAVDAVLEKYRARLELHRKLRANAEFDEIYVPATFASYMPSYSILFYGHFLSLAAAARKADQGDLAGALDELEADFEWHRRMMAGARNLITKMVGVNLVARDALFASELARAKGSDALRERLEKLLRPLSPKETDLSAVLEAEFQQGVRFFYNAKAHDIAQGLGVSYPALAPIEILFLRRNETANQMAQRYRPYEELLKSTPAAHDAAAKRLKDAIPVREGFPGFINPVGKLAVDMWAPEYSDYVARLHDVQVLLAAVALQNALQKAGAVTPEQVAAQLAGDLGKAMPNPYTGKPFEHDAKANVLLFTPKKKGVWVQALQKRYNGKIGVQL